MVFIFNYYPLFSFLSKSNNCLIEFNLFFEKSLTKIHSFSFYFYILIESQKVRGNGERERMFTSPSKSFFIKLMKFNYWRFTDLDLTIKLKFFKTFFIENRGITLQSWITLQFLLKKTEDFFYIKYILIFMATIIT